LHEVSEINRVSLDQANCCRKRVPF